MRVSSTPTSHLCLLDYHINVFLELRHSARNLLCQDIPELRKRRRLASEPLIVLQRQLDELARVYVGVAAVLDVLNHLGWDLRVELAREAEQGDDVVDKRFAVRALAELVCEHVCIVAAEYWRHTFLS
jgi:hypothetical protein